MQSFSQFVASTAVSKPKRPMLAAVAAVPVHNPLDASNYPNTKWSPDQVQMNNKQTMINVLNQSVKDLQQGIDTHCCLVSSLFEERVDERNLSRLLERCPKRSREVALEKAIQEAIDVLEESRKAFKSKRLGLLRKRLTRVLVETT